MLLRSYTVRVSVSTGYYGADDEIVVQVLVLDALSHAHAIKQVRSHMFDLRPGETFKYRCRLTKGRQTKEEQIDTDIEDNWSR